jgi:hypothetical protein
MPGDSNWKMPLVSPGQNSLVDLLVGQVEIFRRSIVHAVVFA